MSTMNPGQVYAHHSIMRPKTFGDKTGMAVGNEAQQVLVKVNPDAPEGYDLVDKVSNPIDFASLKDNYALWEDQSHGCLFWKKPADGKIQRDEVTPFANLYAGKHWEITCPSNSPYPGHHVGCALEDRWELRDDTAEVAFITSDGAQVPALISKTECLQSRPYY